MKFNKYFKANQLEEWAEKYIDYSTLKSIIKKLDVISRKCGVTESSEEKKNDNAHLLSPINLDSAEVSPKAHPNIEAATTVTEIVDPQLGGFMPTFEYADVEAIEKQFANALTLEIIKVAEFYSEQCLFFAQQANQLMTRARRAIMQTNHVTTAEKKHLRRLFRQVYYEVEQLAKYRELNTTAVVKITKKHDKNSSWKELRQLGIDVVSKSNFGTPQFEQYLTERIEDAYSGVLAKEKTAALTRLRQMPMKSRLDKQSCMIGLFAGWSIAVLFTCCILIGSVGDDFWKSYQVRHCWFVFEGSILISIYLWLWGIDIHFFEAKRLNSPYIFEADPSSVMRTPDIFKMAALGSFISLTCCLIFMIELTYGFLNFNPAWLAIVLFCFWIGVAVYPGKAYRTTRSYLYRSLWNQIRSPFSDVRFIDFFIADQWTSLFTIVVDMAFVLCYFTTGDILSDSKSQCDHSNFRTWLRILIITPYWVRFAQCLRRFFDAYSENQPSEQIKHALNGGKYCFAMITVSLSVWNSAESTQQSMAVRIVFGAISTIYACTWDVRMDWGLFAPISDHKFLRKNLRFNPMIYYVAMVINASFRISWAAALFPKSFGITMDMHFITLPLAAIEVSRRCMWNVFRMENEHLNNCGNFRILKCIPELPSFRDIDKEAEAEADKEEKSKHSSKCSISPRRDNQPTMTEDAKSMISMSPPQISHQSEKPMLRYNHTMTTDVTTDDDYSEAAPPSPKQHSRVSPMLTPQKRTTAMMASPESVNTQQSVLDLPVTIEMAKNNWDTVVDIKSDLQLWSLLFEEHNDVTPEMKASIEKIIDALDVNDTITIKQLQIFVDTVHKAGNRGGDTLQSQIFSKLLKQYIRQNKLDI